ncbi:probable WRKY transcription factor 67 [Triticum dicoccoides]|uniref:probable WRKY transcription factor 67 n=1 Tax=Triticum dicoccoides TaxID=85692 RepID=UPI00162C7890|nr:probable WRKY transcription factor 67 [Triticum dicoccoides]
MASCGGAGDDGGRSPPAVVYDDLVEVREHAATLQTMLQGSPRVLDMDARELVKGMMAKLSSAMSVFGSTSGGVEASSGRKKRSATASGPHRRSTSRRRSKSPFINMVTARTLNDGKTWRKYGQKYIHASTNPRSYYRCSHKPDQGCQATRQVQESESNPSEYIISYYGQHTCKDPSTFRSLFIQGAADAAPPADCSNLISFTSINGAAASTSTSAFAHCGVKEAVDLHPMLSSRFSNYSSSPPVQEGVSSGSPSPAGHGKFMQYAGGQLVDVIDQRTSPLTVGSAPAEYWPVAGDAGAGMDSFPSSPSPSSLGFMSGSLGGSFGNSIYDDDLFGFDS